jgi:hypothetical protein
VTAEYPSNSVSKPEDFRLDDALIDSIPIWPRKLAHNAPSQSPTRSTMPSAPSTLLRLVCGYSKVSASATSSACSKCAGASRFRAR